MSAARRLPAGKISRKPRGRGAEGGQRSSRLSPPGGGSGTRGQERGSASGAVLPAPRLRSEHWARGYTLPGSAISLLPSGGGGEANPSIPSRCIPHLQCQRRPNLGTSTPPLQYYTAPCRHYRDLSSAAEEWRLTNRVPEPQPPGPGSAFASLITPSLQVLHKDAFHAASATLCAALQAHRVALAHSPHHQPIPGW